MKISKAKLQKALEIVKPGLANKEVIQQSTSFAFIKGSVVTYNDHISISHPIELDFEGAIEADPLYKFLSKIKTDSDVDMDVNENELSVKIKRSKIGLTLQKEIHLPLKEIDTEGKWQKLPEGFKKAVNFAAAACGRNELQFKLTCVHINKDIIEGSDGYKICRVNLPDEINIKPVLIPASSIIEVAKLTPTYVKRSNAWAHFKNDEDTIISTRIIEEKYVEITDWLDVEGVEIIFPKTLTEVVDRALVFAQREHKLDEEVEIELSDNRIKVKATSDIGWFEEELNVKHKGEPISFVIVPYLLEGILSETNTAILGSKENSLKFEGENWQYVARLKD